MLDLRRVVIPVLVLAVFPARGAAQTAGGEASVSATQRPVVEIVQPAGPPESFGDWHLEVTGGFFLEAWDLNIYKEELVGAAITLSREMTPNSTVGIETSLLHVNQEPIGDVFLPALSVMLRWNGWRVGETAVFVEGGGGVSYASNEVPNRGTRFNLVFQTGAGLAHPLTSRIDLVGGLRWLHLSNNSLDGNSRNPDIQALGLYLGWRVN